MINSAGTISIRIVRLQFRPALAGALDLRRLGRLGAHRSVAFLFINSMPCSSGGRGSRSRALARALPRDFNVFRVNSSKRLGDDLVGDRVEFLDKRLRLCGDVKRHARRSSGSATRSTRLLPRAGRRSRQGDRLDVEHVGELDLPKTRLAVSRNSTFHWARVTPMPDRTAIERLAQRMRRLADLEGKSFHLADCDIISLLILSNA